MSGKRQWERISSTFDRIPTCNFLDDTHTRGRALNIQRRLLRNKLNKHLTYLAWLYLCGHGTRLWATASGIFLNATTRAEIAHKDIWGYVIVVSSHRVSCHIKPPAQRRNRQHRRYVSPGRVLSLPTIFFFSPQQTVCGFPKKKAMGRIHQAWAFEQWMSGQN